MAIPNQDMIQQLSGQLHMVSEIAESLTLRLLALEERLTELSECVNSVEPDQAEDSDNFLLLADSSDRLVQLRGLLNERVVDDGQTELPRLEVVIDSHADDAEHVVDEPVDLDLEQTVYVNDSQEPPSDTADQDREQGDELLSA